MEEHLICLLYLEYIFPLLETNTQKITIFASLLSSSPHNKIVKIVFWNKKGKKKKKRVILLHWTAKALDHWTAKGRGIVWMMENIINAAQSHS